MTNERPWSRKNRTVECGRGHWESIFTDAENVGELRVRIRDAVICHFPDPETRPKIIRQKM